MLRRPYFTELFLTRSRARPRLLFALARVGEWSFYSSPQNSGRGLVHTKFHLKFAQDMWQDFRGFASGLIYFSNMKISKKDDDDDHVVPVVCNPNTRQYAILPKLTRSRRQFSFLGFDPVSKQFKVLFLTSPAFDHCQKILTLESGNLRWRTIQCPLHYPLSEEGICISGVLYYCTLYKIVCFDVRSEKFKFIDAERRKLIDYKGKLGAVSLKDADAGGIELSIWVLEDVEKPEWSKHVYTLCDENKVMKRYYVSVVGVTATGEIVLSLDDTHKPFYVFYFNPERNTLQSVEIQSVGEYHEEFGKHEVKVFVDHVEDLNLNDAKQLKPSPINQGLEIIRKRPKPEKPPTSVGKNKLQLKNKYDLLDNLE